MSWIPFLYLIPAGVIGLILLLSLSESLPAGGEETEGIRGWFTRAGAMLYRTLPLFRRKGKTAQVSTDLAVLKPRNRAEESGVLYYADKIGMTLLLIFAGSILACVVSFTARQERLVDDEGHVARSGYGGGARRETLVLNIEGSDRQDEIEIEISERQYTDEQADALFAQAAEELTQVILGENISLDEVRSDLQLVKELDEYPFVIAWKVSDYEMIHADGKIQTENVPEEGVAVMLTAQYSYLERGWEQEIPVCIYPPLYTQEELWLKSIRKLLEEADRETVHEPYIALPEQIGNSVWSWSGKIRDDAPLLFLLILAAAIAVYFMKDKDLEKQVHEREEEMILDYPQFVSKLVLYLGAGMTVRNVFSKLAGDYQVRRAAGAAPRFLYEEICRVVHELDSGVSEGTAYEHFSLRCRSQQYTRLCTLLSQNLRKGNSGLLPLLHEESRKALAERMDNARKRGEEAGTKLLMPMMLMLVIVMVIIMLPAFFSL